MCSGGLWGDERGVWLRGSGGGPSGDLRPAVQRGPALSGLPAESLSVRAGGQHSLQQAEEEEEEEEEETENEETWQS